MSGSVTEKSSKRTKGGGTHPDLAALLSDHLAVLHHVHRAQVDRVVGLVPQPVLIALMNKEGEKRGRCHEVVVREQADREVAESHVTCLMAVTVMTKKSGSPLVMGLVGVSIISYGGGKKTMWMLNCV